MFIYRRLQGKYPSLTVFECALYSSFAFKSAQTHLVTSADCDKEEPTGVDKEALAKIVEGFYEYPYGFEDEEWLASTFGRHVKTIRKALNDLEKLGLIRRCNNTVKCIGSIFAEGYDKLVGENKHLLLLTYLRSKAIYKGYTVVKPRTMMKETGMTANAVYNGLKFLRIHNLIKQEKNRIYPNETSEVKDATGGNEKPKGELLLHPRRENVSDARKQWL